MKIGAVEISDHVAKKPVSVTVTGKFLTAEQVAAKPELSLGSLFTLDADQQIDLTVERYRFEPKLRLGIVGVGVLSRDEIVEHVKAKTPFGLEAVQAEMFYCNTITAALAGGGVTPAGPTVPGAAEPTWPDWKKQVRCILLKVTNRALFCENTTDGVTTPFAQYRIDHVHPVFRARGFSVVVLSGTDDVRANFVPQAKSSATVYLSGIGHGNYNLYTGHMGDHILESCHYDSAEVEGKSIHFLSCQTATGLGPDTVAKGASSYAGYTEDFVLVWDDGSTPAVNEFELFARSDSTYDLAMANGSTALVAYEATKAAFTAAMASVPNMAAATWLLWDRDHLALHGNRASKIAPFRWVKFCYPLPMEVEDQLMQLGELSD